MRGEDFVGVLGLRATHLELAGLRRRGFQVLANRLVWRVLLHPEQEFILGQRRDGGQVGMLEGDPGYHRLLPGIRCAEDHFVGIARGRLAIGVALGAAAATFVDDHDRLIGQLVFDDAVLNRASEIVSPAAGSGGGDELNGLGRPPFRRCGRGKQHGNGAGGQDHRFCSGTHVSSSSLGYGVTASGHHSRACRGIEVTIAPSSPKRSIC
jgi:hypothetical protein